MALKLAGDSILIDSLIGLFVKLYTRRLMENSQLTRRIYSHITKIFQYVQHPHLCIKVANSLM